ncbi:MAG: LptF/LptG family permease, partial [Rhodospirillaceae bacterium]
MRLSSTLSVYVGRHFLVAFGALLSLFLFLVLLFDTVELLRRAASKPNIDFGMVIEMALLKLPYMCQEIFPFAVLFGCMACFWRLTRSNEMVVTRGAGVSVWQFLLPPITIAALLGIFQITTIN